MEEKPKGRATNQAVKLMIIRDYLYSHSNKDHLVTSKDIIKHLNSKGIRADRKTIFSDINRLEDDYGLEIVRGKGYRIAHPQFEPNELRLMIDSVQSAKFITEREASAITNKIKDLSDIYTRSSLDRKSYVDDRIFSMKDSVVSDTDVIHEAISKDMKISFKYAHRVPSLETKKRYSNDGAPYIVSPFALYWNNGNYYLYAYLTEAEEFRYFRIDRMEWIRLSPDKREGNDKFSASVLNGKRKAKVFDMYAGEVANVRLRAHNSLADPIVDVFGDKVILAPDGNDHFTVNVYVQVSPTFFAWLTNFGDRIEITNPPKVREEMKKYIEKIAELYSK